MKNLIALALCLTAVQSVFTGVKHDQSAAVISQFWTSSNKTSPTHINTGCVALHCAWAMAKAVTDPMFGKLTKCENGCDGFFYNDTSEMKLQYQNCTTKCSLTYSS